MLDAEALDIVSGILREKAGGLPEAVFHGAGVGDDASQGGLGLGLAARGSLRAGEVELGRALRDLAFELHRAGLRGHQPEFASDMVVACDTGRK